MPIVTILLPNYNNGPYLRECLDSVVNQTFQDYKLLMVDDGSTDNSVEIFKSYQNDKFVLIEKEMNSGIVDSLNVGLDHLDTKYMIRLDGDDYMTEDRLEILVNFMENHPEYDVCGSGLQMFGEHEQTVRFEKDWVKNKANMIFNHSVGHATLIFRSHLFTEKGYRYSNDFKYMEDYHLLLDMMEDAKYTTLDEILYFYRQTEAHLPMKVPEERKPIYISFYKMLLAKFNSGLEKNAELHFQLAKETPVTYKYSEFKDHCQRIMNANSATQLFPQDQLTEKLGKALDRIRFRLIDQGQLGLKHALAKPKLFKYYLRSKF